MQGLIWGLVRVDGEDPELSAFKRLSDAVTNEYQVGPASVLSIEAGSIGFSALHPKGAPSLPAVDAYPNMVADFRFYGRNAGDGIGHLHEALGNGNLRSVADLEGDFAAAFWQPDQKTLILCRDQLGIRSLFFAHRPGEWVAFCSIALPLVNAGIATDAPDLKTIARQYTGDYNTGTDTFLSQIKRVPAGHFVSVNKRRVEVKKYWSLPPTRDPISEGTDVSIISKEARRLLDNAVRKRLPDSGSVGSHCSGGLDSSSLTVIAAQQLSGRGDTVVGCHVAASRREDVDPVDGTPQVNAIAQRHEGVEIVRVEATPFGDSLTSELRCDLPWPVDRSFNHWETIAEKVGERGITTVFTGFGAEQTLSSHGAGSIFGALMRGRVGFARRLAQDLAIADGASQDHKFYGEIFNRLVPRFLRKRIRSYRGMSPDGFDFTLQFLTEKGRQLVRIPPQPMNARAARRKRLTDGVLATSAEAGVEMSARHGVALAYPYLDKDLIEYTLRLPEDVYVRDGTRRWLLRDAMSELLPEMISSQRVEISQDNSRALALVEVREEMLAEIDRLSSTCAAEYVDLPTLRQAISDLPDVEDVRAETQKQAAEGMPSDKWISTLELPFALARFLARSEL